MQFVEVVVNVPVRRIQATMAQRPQMQAARMRRQPLPAPAVDEPPDEELLLVPPDGDEDDPPLETFTYHLPPALEAVVRPGHLVWVPFRTREIQGIVVRLADTAEVQTRPVLRLARPESVLSEQQLRLAGWIAHTYVASMAESVRLFLPPRLLQSSPDKLAVQSKRELSVELIAAPDEIEARLLTLGKATTALRILDWYLANPGAEPAAGELRAAIGVTAVPLADLVKRGWLERVGDSVRLAVAPADARRAAEAMRGLEKYRRVLAVLEPGLPLWRSELYERVDTDTATLRSLQNAGIIQLDERVRFRDPLQGRTYARTHAPPLTSEQSAVWNTICEHGFSRAGEANRALRFLLHGVTGSGKTEIYLRSIGRVLEEGRQAIVLVPEIALAPQTVARFAGRFPGRVTVIHSALSPGERYDVWRAIRNGEFDVVVGPRSALFAPLPRLGLIVVDEEHESSYKQSAEEWGSLTVFYDARTVAQRLAELTGSLLIFGSATPSMELYTQAQAGGVRLLSLPRRVVGHAAAAGELDAASDAGVPTLYAALPPVEVVDMRQELRAGHRSIFSRSLQSELIATLDAGEQAILFLNRRGTSTFVMCRDCGHVENCPRCDVPLVFHERAGYLLCHHCNRRYPIPAECPNCHSSRIRYFGSGTQQVERAVQEIIPRARLLRWDADTTGARGSHEEILQRFAAHEADVLVGTQMIAKGLDLPLVTLVGVVAAEVGLYLPDFRSAERTFQLLTQVSGRAGRSARGGRVVIQSYSPEHYAIRAAAAHDYDAFYRREMVYRRELQLPPVRRLTRLIYWHKKPDLARRAALLLGDTLRVQIAELGLDDETRLIGPAPAFFARSRGFYRWQIQLVADDPAAILRQTPIPMGWRIDVDPVSVL